MPVEPIHQSLITPVRILNVVPRDVFVVGFIPGALIAVGAYMLHNYLLLTFAILATVAAQTALGWMCHRDHLAIHRYLHARGLPARLLAKSNLQGIQVSHR